MKFPVLLLLLFLIPLSTEAQHSSPLTSGIDARLYQVYDKEYLETLLRDQSQMLYRLNFYLDHSWFLSEYPPEKGNPVYPTVQISDTEHFNILLLEKEQGIHAKWDGLQVYRINGGNRLLVLYSGKEFVKKWNEFRGVSNPDFNRGVKVTGSSDQK